LNKSASPSNLVLEVSDIRVQFGGVKAVDGASIGVSAGSITSMIGPNGAGKTTLFNLISGAIKSDSGKVIFQGEEIQGLHPHQIAHRGMVRTFQGAKVIKRLSVLDNVMLGGQDNPGEGLIGFFRPSARAKYEESARIRAMELLSQVGIERFANEYAGILSGGQRKLLDLARALMAQPKMLLLDEPFAGVNPTLVEKLIEVINNLRKERELTFLLVEHDLETVMNISDKVIVLAQGKVIADGLPRSIYENESVIDAYLGSRKK
jgi:ABC-type branched-subunit amino acid transport system ATPase component